MTKERTLEDERGVPPNSNYWDDERIQEADKLALTLSETDGVTGVMNDPLMAEYRTKREPLTAPKEFVEVFPEGGGVYPVVYDRDAVDSAESLSAIRAARGDETTENGGNADDV